jgi:hypothetical protein
MASRRSTAPKVALVASPDARLADRLAELCENVQAKVDRIDQ